MNRNISRKSKIKYILNNMYLEPLCLYFILFFTVGAVILRAVVYIIGGIFLPFFRILFGDNLSKITRLVKFFISTEVIIIIGVIIVFIIILNKIIKKKFFKSLLLYNIFKYHKSDFKVYKGIILPFLFSIILILYFFLMFLSEVDILYLCLFIFTLLISITLLNYAEQINKIMYSIDNIAKLQKTDISYIGSFGFTLEAVNMLNNIDQNISETIESQLKSERLKTELITNISHDLKTPLTSIINYTDLLKNLDIKDSTALDYITVLDRNSKRLKVLITDLVDASKTETGNVNINLKKLELNELISQIYGDFDSLFNEKEITFVFDPQEDIYVLADGDHLGRVLENILGNAYKYTQEKTRVYGAARREGDFVIFSLKNVSKEKLNIEPDELMEQFVRGERSRHTEGSGLGLYIARNLMELMNGELLLSINGDLFEAKLVIPTFNK
ncbi:sensor histidine kinase [Paratissierella segnis]|uniref:histidine kinase n=1 Tax=Paratissierella segnis TaxID=2763679 RepID=A0A926ESR0_9FIRM|nr:HAMP domain-containing sensor histidine kinase [Paratissierella segnis]MBC8587840.1 HAMP domain-containing histidine kinase [Paratissierella segnis]